MPKIGKLTENQIIMLKLIQRSADIGDGWRQVSSALWHHVADQTLSELTELDEPNHRVRLTAEGETVMRYAL